MLCRISAGRFVPTMVAVFALYAIGTSPLQAQSGSLGTVVVSVQDQTGAVVPGADLELRDLATNYVRKAQTQEAGAYTFTNLPNGTYRLSVVKAGYAGNVFDSVLVQASQTTNVKATLKVGAISEVVTVTETATPLMVTSSNAIGTAIDLKEIEDLPMVGRDLTQLSQLVPGYSNVPGLGGTWDGMPQIAQGNNIDGVISSTSRMKFAGNGEPDVQPRLENIQEMTVQTEQLDMNQGFGAANMQINFITRRGSNAFHGRVFEDFRNTALNANSWVNDALGLPKNVVILNEFGGSAGGAIVKDKLFVFGNFSMSKTPGTINVSNTVLNSPAQAGNFTYIDTNGQTQVVNVLGVATGQGYAGANAAVSGEISAINGALSHGALSAVAGDPNLSNLTWQVAAPRTIYFPTVRVDYDISQKYRLNVSFNETKGQPVSAFYSTYNPPPFPGPTFANRGGHNHGKYYTAGLGFDWTVSPTVINEFRAGYLYHADFNSYDAAALWLTQPQVNWAVANQNSNVGASSGASYQTPVSDYYPTFNASDSVTWQHAAHTLKFGFSMFREQDHYYNNPVGWPTINLGLAGGDPVATNNVFTSGPSGTIPNSSPGQLAEAQNLYATLAGRITGISTSYAYSPKTGGYTGPAGYYLDELQKSWGLFVQDSYRLRPNLTLNYGLRWDFTGDDHDLTGSYHQALPAAVFGPSGVWNVFNPGSLNGDPNPSLIATTHQYHPWNVSPQPAFGFAWDPRNNGKTIVRGGVSVRKYTEPYQYFWDNASDYGSFFYQFAQTNASNTGGAGTFVAGSLALGSTQPCYVTAPTCPTYLLAPATYQKVAPESQFTFVNGWYNNDAHGIDPHIKQPYTTSWNLGVQRELSKDNVVEFRYVGSRSVHQWLSLQTNEVNIFQSGQYGFLTNFKAAQANLAANNASGNPNYAGSFANHGLTGQQATPLFDAAFTGEKAGVDGSLEDYTSSAFALNLTNGAAGTFAQAMTTTSGTVDYFCNLVGSSFAPCPNNVNFPTGQAGVVPINFFQVNPFNSGIETSYMTNFGYATHNGLQVDFRQKQWHGMQFDANYTWSHTLGTNPTNNWTGVTTQFSLRKPRMNYGPTLDLRHVIHASGTYDLPFGHGKPLLNHSRLLDRVVGGWTLGTIVSYQTGSPFQMGGGFGTFNDYADGGINLNGVTVSQLQHSVGVHRVTAAENGGSPAGFVDVIDPKYMASVSGGPANSSFITPNKTPGVFALHPWLYGPHLFDTDMSLAKVVSITERVKFSLQSEFLNVFNHPNFGTPDAGIQDFGFGTTGGTVSAYQNSPNGGSRMLELRANIEF